MLQNGRKNKEYWNGNSTVFGEPSDSDDGQRKDHTVGNSEEKTIPNKDSNNG